MKKPEQPANEERRTFLKLAATAAPAAAVTAVSGTEAAAEDLATEGKGLRKTAHVQAYLDSARF
jgi:hypothetical protein